VLAGSPDPLAVVRGIQRFSDAAVSRATLFSDLADYPPLLDLLVRILGHSGYFTDILVRDPALFRWLTAGDVLGRPFSPGHLAEEVRRAVSVFSRPAARIEALKRLHRREILRIGTLDLLGMVDLAGATRQLSHLADAVLDAALDLAAAEAMERYGTSPAVPIAVIGLGKLGGEELNYSSDVDVLFVFGEDGTCPTDRGPVTHVEFFHRLAEQFIRILTAMTDGGSLYRVDARLRPESGAGPLARSLAGYLQYYEERGELWERQMLIKARPVAGDRALGEQFIHALEPFVYPRTQFAHPAASAARLKARIEAALGDELNVKLMAGGIRDIEFVAQVLQLVHGGKAPELRERNTVRALRSLAGAGLLPADEGEMLIAAYGFFRTVEHRLQTALNTQTHTLPDEHADRDRLARRVGLVGGSDLMDAIGKHTSAVRDVFSRILVIPEDAPETGAAASIDSLVDGSVSDERMRKILAQYAFADFPAALRHLRVLFGGSAIRNRPEFEARTREALRAVVGPLFAEIARSPVPDLTLAGIAQIAGAQRFPQQLYAQLAERGARKLFVDLCARAPRFVRLLARDAALLEAIPTGTGVLGAASTEAPHATADLATFKVTQEARSGIRYALGFIDQESLFRELSDTADRIARTVADAVCREKEFREPPAAIIALGKFGSTELGFDGDLDLFFVCTSARMLPRAEEFATAFLAEMTRSSAEGQLYRVDVRLRPEGRNAPLVATLDGYTRYLEGRASLWERQSMTRLRAVAGDGVLGKEVERVALEHVYRRPLPERWVESIVTMRKSMEPRSHFRGPSSINLKKSPGGLVDVEFVAQMGLLHGAADAIPLHARPVREILDHLPAALVTADETASLIQAQRRFREIETRMRIVLEDRSPLLPQGEALERLARFVGSENGEALAADVRATMDGTRKVLLAVAGRCSSR
jgi:glutamate-ammonia-ligase adenylyltransferase